MDCWWDGMIMACPPKMAGVNTYPAYGDWPGGELYFTTDYVWSHTEFTPQQTMRGKQALFGYLYGIYKGENPSVVLSENFNKSLNPNIIGSSLIVSVSASLVTLDIVMPGKIELQLFDVLGRLNATLFSGQLEQGRHNIKIPKNLSSGIRFLRVKRDGLNHVLRLQPIKIRL